MIRAYAASLPLLATLLGLFGSCGLTQPRPQDGLRRSIWVTRYEYRTVDDIRRVMADCAGLGLSSVFFQVRGNGTVYYDSKIETWSEVHNFMDPGFDPLEIAVEAAHKHGLQLHAWVNMVPGWRGDLDRAAPRQLVAIRPTWFLGKKDDKPLKLGENYYWLNPCLPEVRDYLTSICREIVTRYDVDGLHLDYMRFSDLSAPVRAQIPGDRRSVELFRSVSGKTPAAAPAEFEQWKANCVTQLLRQISTTVRAEAGLLSVAVVRDPIVARDRYCQNWEAWTRERLVDAIVPMNYDDDNERFRRTLEAQLLSAQGVSVIEGIGVFKHRTSDQTILQMRYARDAGAAGISLFSYSQLFRRGDLKVRKRRYDLDQVFRKYGR